MKRHGVSWLLAILLALAILPGCGAREENAGSGSAQQSGETSILQGEIGTVQWTLEDGTLTFTGEGIIREAAWLEEPYRVERDDITAVIFGDGIEDFNYGLFSACGNLRSVTFGDGFTCVPSEAFVDCASLEEVRFGKNVTRIDGWAFQRCGLKEVVLPEGLTLINGEAFQGCQDLESVTIPDSVTDIEESAFDGCERLTIHAREGSFAERFAAALGIPFSAS